jgi:hypothetical protein
MKRSLIPMAALALFLTASSAHAAGVTPPATKYQSSLTEPTPVTGSDFVLTKASQVQVTVSATTLTIKLKLNGVLNGGVPVAQTDNQLQVDLRYGGLLHTLSFDFDLAKGKTDNALTKFDTSLTSLGIASDDSIEVRTVRCLEGGAGPGAGLSFCVPSLTAK